jgi:hypothetical protein
MRWWRHHSLSSCRTTALTFGHCVPAANCSNEHWPSRTSCSSSANPRANAGAGGFDNFIYGTLSILMLS